MTNYKEFVTNIIRDYKLQYHNNTIKYSVPILYGDKKVGRLRPIPVLQTGDAKNDIYYQTKWRNLHTDSFLVEPFVATETRTLSWLEKVYFNNNEQIIFMIEDENNHPIGHLALENFIFDEYKCEYGRLMRGEISPQEKREKINLIELAQITLLNWGFNILKLNSVYGTQFSHNYPVSRLHEKCGFKRIDEKDHVKEAATVKIASVELKKENFAFYKKQ